jgi:hypothetical protein
MKSSNFIASEMLEALTYFPLTEEEEAAYDAPFPTRTHMAGIRVFPSLINEIPGTTDQAWEGLGCIRETIPCHLGWKRSKHTGKL